MIPPSPTGKSTSHCQAWADQEGKSSRSGWSWTFDLDCPDIVTEWMDVWPRCSPEGDKLDTTECVFRHW